MEMARNAGDMDFPGLYENQMPVPNRSDKGYLHTKGRIFDIQRYSIHDGKGIRTIVFLKGCVLRCKWCCNPESQEYQIQTMTVQGKPKVIGRDVTVGEVMETVVKDEPYYRRSGGGLTLSGGESLCQAEFARDLLHAAKARGMNTAMESMAGLPYEKIEMLLPYLDNYLMDIKHIDPEKHRDLTMQPNGNILKFAAYLNERHVDMWIRHVVVPGITDDEKYLFDLGYFIGQFDNLKALDVLPYHTMGEKKYQSLGMEYKLKGVPAMDKDKLLDKKKAIIDGIKKRRA